MYFSICAIFAEFHRDSMNFSIFKIQMQNEYVRIRDKWSQFSGHSVPENCSWHELACHKCISAFQSNIRNTSLRASTLRRVSDSLLSLLSVHSSKHFWLIQLSIRANSMILISPIMKYVLHQVHTVLHEYKIRS